MFATQLRLQYCVARRGGSNVLSSVKLVCEFWTGNQALADVSRESATPNLLRATAGCTTYKIPESKCIITGKQRTGAERASSAHFLSVIRSSTFRWNILWNIAMHFASLYMLVCTSIEFCPPPTSSCVMKNNLVLQRQCMLVLVMIKDITRVQQMTCILSVNNFIY